MSSTTTRADALVDVFNEYLAGNGITSAFPPDVIAWGMSEGKLGFSDEEVAAALLRQLKKALKDKTARSRSGKKYRTHVCARRSVFEGGEIKQRRFWFHVRDADRDELEDSVAIMSNNVFETQEAFKEHVAGLNEDIINPGDEPLSDDVHRLPGFRDDDDDEAGGAVPSGERPTQPR